MTYASLNDLKIYVLGGTADTLQDTELTNALNAAVDLVDGYCGRTFTAAGTAVTDRVYTAQSCGYVAIDDATSIDEVATSTSLDGTYDDVWGPTDWQGEPLNGLVAGREWPFTTVRAVGGKRFTVTPVASVKVSATFGWSSVPESVRQATLIQAARLFKRSGATLGITGNAETGLMRVTGSIDTDAARLLLPYRKSAGIAVA